MMITPPKAPTPGDRAHLLLKMILRVMSLEQRGMTVIKEVLSGVLIGVMSPRELTRITIAHFNRAGSYISEDHLRRGLFTWEEAMVSEHFPGHGTVGVPGAGGGRQVAALLKRGYKVVASDPAPQHVDELRRNFKDTPGFQGAASTLELLPGGSDAHLDAIMCGWGMLSYVPSHSNRARLLRRLAASLRPDGVLLLSYWTASRRRGPLVALSQALSVTLGRFIPGSRPRPGDCIMFNPGTAYYGHYFTLDEIYRLAESAGLEMITHADTPYGYAVLRRI